MTPTVADSRADAVPGWYWAVALAALLFEGLGCFMYLSQVGADPASLPIDQQATWRATPDWIVAAYGTAVWVGLLGALALLLRRRIAQPLLGVSLVAVCVQFGGVLLVPGLRETISSDALIVPTFIVLIAFGLFRFARMAGRRGWLR